MYKLHMLCPRNEHLDFFVRFKIPVIYIYIYIYNHLALSVFTHHQNWAVSLVIARGHFDLPRGFCGYVWVKILTFPQEFRLPCLWRVSIPYQQNSVSHALTSWLRLCDLAAFFWECPWPPAIYGNINICALVTYCCWNRWGIWSLENRSSHMWQTKMWWIIVGIQVHKADNHSTIFMLYD